jgi:hypothetical protein
VYAETPRVTARIAGATLLAGEPVVLQEPPDQITAPMPIPAPTRARLTATAPPIITPRRTGDRAPDPPLRVCSTGFIADRVVSPSLKG